MSDLSKLTRAPRSDVIPGKVLSPFGLNEFAMAEEHFARQHLKQAAAGCEGLPAWIAQTLLKEANADIRDGAFNWGARGFDAASWSKHEVPFLLWLSLRVTDPAITRPEAKALITKDNEATIHHALLELMGFPMPEPGETGNKPGSTKKSDPPSEAAPTGDQSSEPSASAA